MKTLADGSGLLGRLKALWRQGTTNRIMAFIVPACSLIHGTEYKRLLYNGVQDKRFYLGRKIKENSIGVGIGSLLK